ncbi:MAG: DUF5060 domain-containing protein [Litorimonas sp.]
MKNLRLSFFGLVLCAALGSCVPELNAGHKSKISKSNNATIDSATPFFREYVTLDFIGPQTSESANVNPFTDMELKVVFYQDETEISIRGYFAADGNAAETSASSGNVWRAHFTAPSTGEWFWKASMTGPDGPMELDQTSGSIRVSAVTPILRTQGQHFQFSTGEPWLKGGANSPENLLGFADFDGTYRTETQMRGGESNATDTVLHTFTPHLNDWRPQDPVWQGDKGKGLIGAVNYLSDQGMNAVYFLTFNIGGDGKDVWPFIDHEDFNRFDVSKLDQWNIVFDHMMARGVMMHVVLQETENELTLDGGNTGAQRELYFKELISRFAHHPALVWNLGEENGPVFWRPEGQTDDQRRDMIKTLTRFDPYDHPIVLHTHSEPADKDHILDPLLGFEGLDGLSFQVSDRRKVNSETQKWLSQSNTSGQPWLITMDEIGSWHTGARTDAVDPAHDSLRRHALWGHLFAGGAGVEWYFGGLHEANDLKSEDWRKRQNLWFQTRAALDFFNKHLPYWEMTPCGGVIDRADSYCFGKDGLYAIYLIEGGTGILSLPEGSGTWDVDWFDPVKGGPLTRGTNETVSAGSWVQLGFSEPNDGRDRVVLLRRKS